MLTQIRVIHADAREAYGAVKTWRVLRAQGVACGRHRVARLRRAHGIEARRMRRFRLAYQARNSAPAGSPPRGRIFNLECQSGRQGNCYSACRLEREEVLRVE